MTDRIKMIRMSEKEYHDDCYDNQTLFEAGSWLHKPVKTVLDQFEALEPVSEMRVLDLGCGVGRNSIPTARHLQASNGKVVCVDFLDSAIHHLKRYSKVYGVAEQLEMIVSDISQFTVIPNHYQYIYAVSTLEHLDSIETFDRVIERMKAGTTNGGINCFIISSNIQEIEVETGNLLDPMFELLFETDELLHKLETLYKGWQVLKQTVKGYELEIQRADKPVLLKSDVVTWSVRK
ncbi:class I SAM-dependent methyltransferase [Paenibacillus whitsoniae]|nr:methyltransferase domain-containing protein [Paenibacillus whitsoniae]